MARLKDRYREEIAPALKDRFEIQNPMRIPKLEKIVVNMGVGEAAQDSRRLDGAMEDHRPEAAAPARAKEHRRLQNPGRHAGRGEGYAPG
jgi:large subunit ribosomal protein L5